LGGGTTSDKILNEGYVPAKGTLATPSDAELYAAVNPGQKQMSMAAWNATPA
jgi:hypothetical protein